MTERQTLRQHLEELLGINANDPKIVERLFSVDGKHPNRLETPEFAVASAEDRNILRQLESIEVDSENFIFESLPNTMTLYEPTNIIQATKEFYDTNDLRLSNHHITTEGYDETLRFGNPKVGGYVLFNLGKGFRKDQEGYELWITADFYDLRK